MAAPQLMDAWSQSIMSALAMTAELQLQLCSRRHTPFSTLAPNVPSDQQAGKQSAAAGFDLHLRRSPRRSGSTCSMTQCGGCQGCHRRMSLWQYCSSTWRHPRRIWRRRVVDNILEVGVAIVACCIVYKVVHKLRAVAIAQHLPLGHAARCSCSTGASELPMLGVGMHAGAADTTKATVLVRRCNSLMLSWNQARTWGEYNAQRGAAAAAAEQLARCMLHQQG